MSNEKRHWVPEIAYQETPDDSPGSDLPIIKVPNNEDMPRLLYFNEVRELEEEEEGLPVVEYTLHQYVNTGFLKENLNLDEYNRIREVLGLQPLQEAVAEGKKITDSIRDKVSK